MHFSDLNKEYICYTFAVFSLFLFTEVAFSQFQQQRRSPDHDFNVSLVDILSCL